MKASARRRERPDYACGVNSATVFLFIYLLVVVLAYSLTRLLACLLSACQDFSLRQCLACENVVVVVFVITADVFVCSFFRSSSVLNGADVPPVGPALERKVLRSSADNKSALYIHMHIFERGCRPAKS